MQDAQKGGIFREEVGCDGSLEGWEGPRRRVEERSWTFCSCPGPQGLAQAVLGSLTGPSPPLPRGEAGLWGWESNEEEGSCFLHMKGKGREEETGFC